MTAESVIKDTATDSSTDEGTACGMACSTAWLHMIEVMNSQIDYDALYYSRKAEADSSGVW